MSSDLDVSLSGYFKYFGRMLTSLVFLHQGYAAHCRKISAFELAENKKKAAPFETAFFMLKLLHSVIDSALGYLKPLPAESEM